MSHRQINRQLLAFLGVEPKGAMKISVTLAIDCYPIIEVERRGRDVIYGKGRPHFERTKEIYQLNEIGNAERITSK